MNLKDISEEKIEALALNEYPVNRVKDVDGDWYDRNKYLRNAFITGFNTAKYVVLLDENEKLKQQLKKEHEKQKN